MEQLPPSSKYVARANEPVSDTERQSLEKRLGDEFEAGRIDHEDYIQTLDALYEAKTMGELVPVAQKVPEATAGIPAIVGQAPGQPGELAPINSGPGKQIVLLGGGLGALLLILVLLLILL